jgi:hypothetical protein
MSTSDSVDSASRRPEPDNHATNQHQPAGDPPPPGPIRRYLRNYAARHRHPANIALHGLGLPVTFLLPLFLLGWGGFRTGGPWALIAFFVGYALQFLGHAFEGNDAGEVVLVKKWIGRPYREFGPAPPRDRSRL